MTSLVVEYLVSKLALVSWLPPELVVGVKIRPPGCLDYSRVWR